MAMSDANDTDTSLMDYVKDQLRQITWLVEFYRRARRTLDFWRLESSTPYSWPRGHYYSPLPSTKEATQYLEAQLQHLPHVILKGIELDAADHRNALEHIAILYEEFVWSDNKQPNLRFHLHQDFYRRADAILLYGMMRIYKPKRVIEIGSGWSSCLMLDVRDRFLANDVHFTFIEPYPERLLEALNANDQKKVRLIRRPVQEVDLSIFAELNAGDFLIIDSSHVSRVGSDVNHIFFEVLPILRKGVWIHFHDIFWPFEYPMKWVVGEGRAWTEAYLLRAFLEYNNHFKIRLWGSWLAQREHKFLQEKLPHYLIDEASAIWVQRVS